MNLRWSVECHLCSREFVVEAPHPLPFVAPRHTRPDNDRVDCAASGRNLFKIQQRPKGKS